MHKILCSACLNHSLVVIISNLFVRVMYCRFARAFSCCTLLQFFKCRHIAVIISNACGQIVVMVFDVDIDIECIQVQA